jgi:hypothetical protein
MADADLYDTDILAWSEQQAAVLRALAGRRDLPNDLDLSNIVEEIEDLGLSQLNSVKSFIRLILTHAIKCYVDPEAPSLLHWYDEIGTWQADLGDRMTASMRQKLDMDALWKQATKQAVMSLRANDRLAQMGLVQVALSNRACPVGVDDLSADPADLVVRLADGLRVTDQADRG